MRIHRVSRPALVVDPDVFQVVEIPPDHTDLDIATFCGWRTVGGPYFHWEVTRYDNHKATVRLSKD